jgi:hypothetical protein
MLTVGALENISVLAAADLSNDFKIFLTTELVMTDPQVISVFS